MKLRLSIKDKLVIYFGLIMIVGFLICGLITNVVINDVIERKALTNLARLAKDTADKISIILDQKQLMIEQLSKLEGISDENKSVEEKLEILIEANKVLQFTDLAIVDLEGNSYGADDMRMNIPDSEEFVIARQGRTSFSPAINIGDEVYFTISVPIRNSSGEIISVLMGVENAEAFTYLLRQSGISDELMVLDSVGHMVMHSNQTIFNEAMSMEGTKDSPQYVEVYELYQKMLNGENGAFECARSEDGEENYISYAPIGMGWSIVLVSYKDNVVKVIDDFNRILMIVIGSIIILGIGAVYFVARGIAARMNKITYYLDTVAHGDFEQSVPEALLELGDEVGDAARALDSMKSEIEDMLSIIKECTDYMNEQVEDLTDDVKDEIKVLLNTQQADEMEREQVMNKLQALQQVKDCVEKIGVKDEKNSF